MTERTVLICGASIAGPALAYWLQRQGWRTVVVERAPGLRVGGQNVDIRGSGREVIRRMGLEDAVRAATTGEAGVRFVDADNAIVAEFAAGTSDSDGPTAEVEILRGDLSQLLYDQTVDTTEYVFGDRVTRLVDGADGVTVSFEHGEERMVDVVVAADGIGSSTRALVFGGEVDIRPLGLYTAYLSIPRSETDSAWARWYNAPGGRTLTLRPDNVGTTRATLSFLSPPRGYERLTPEGQKEVLRAQFADAGGEAPRILDAMQESTDVYFESIGQVRMKRWSRGRFALLGDAGYCASPISGMGTSLALVGAYVLAGELGRNATHTAGFAAYEATMRPYVEQAQQLPPGAPRLAHPKTTLGIKAFNTGLKVASSGLATRVGAKIFSSPADKIEMPDYAM